MQFVNEYGSEEDIEKFGLVELMDRFRPNQRGEQFTYSQPMLTIDRESNTFYMTYAQGREDHSNHTYALLWVDGCCVEVELDLADASTGKLDAVPFTRVWELARLRLPEDISLSREAVKNILKSALTTYGYRGVRKQIPDTIVEFKF